MRVYFATGVGKGKYELNAFDNALINLGIGNANLTKLSSVLPENAKVVYELPRDVRMGEIISAVYVYTVVKEGKAACGLALGYRKEGGGLFYEYEGINKYEVDEILEKMIKEAFDMRGWELSMVEKKIVEVEGDGKEYRCGIAVAAFFE